MTGSKQRPTDEHVIDLVASPFRDWLNDWCREEALRRIEPTLKRIFEPTFGRFTALLDGDEDPNNPRDDTPRTIDGGQPSDPLPSDERTARRKTAGEPDTPD